MRRTWWKESVVYQIYPRSFRDSNADGIGDIPGISEKLDYLQSLGVDVVWLCPVYRSPNDDNGYDISDYESIMPEFGTIEDWDRLTAGLHARGMRIVMDLVVNHTSDEHPWFVSARSAKDSPYRDFYIWRDGHDGREPNNWASFFGGSAWEYNAATGDYYLHLFSRKQPDLNWENPAVRRAVYDMMHRWLRRGVDGFRMDVINALSKVQTFPDAPNPTGARYVFAPQYFMQGPRLLEFFAEMKREVLSHYDVMTVGEAALTTPDEALAMVRENGGTMNMLISFEHTDIDMTAHSFATKWHRIPFELARLRGVLAHWQRTMGDVGWNCLYFNNHDQPRAVSRFGDDQRFWRESATMLATVLHLHQGTPFVYQGEEIGMTNVAFPAIADYRDIETLNGYRELVEVQGVPPAAALEKIHFRSRDNARTPMQWDASATAGFTAGAPWIGVNPNHTAINVAAQDTDPDSVLNYYRRLIRLRRDHPVIVYGRYDLIDDAHPQVYAFTRTLDDSCLLVLANFSGAEVGYALPRALTVAGSALLLGNGVPLTHPATAQVTLLPYEARIYRVEPASSRAGGT